VQREIKNHYRMNGNLNSNLSWLQSTAKRYGMSMRRKYQRSVGNQGEREVGGTDGFGRI